MKDMDCGLRVIRVLTGRPPAEIWSLAKLWWRPGLMAMDLFLVLCGLEGQRWWRIQRPHRGRPLCHWQRARDGAYLLWPQGAKQGHWVAVVSGLVRDGRWSGPVDEYPSVAPVVVMVVR